MTPAFYIAIALAILLFVTIRMVHPSKRVITAILGAPIFVISVLIAVQWPIF